MKAALSSLSDDNGPGGKPVRRVRLFKRDESAVPIRSRSTGMPYKAVAPGENHHIDIVQMRDGSWRGFAATVFEVNQKGWRPVWEREKLGGKLVMRLHKGDLVEVDDADGIRRIKAVVQIEAAAERLRLVAHSESGAFQKRNDDAEDPFRWDLATISKLRLRKCRAVKINEVGQKSFMKTNVLA